MNKKTYIKAFAILCIAALTLPISATNAAKKKKKDNKETIDYYSMYNNGESFNVGDLVVNKKTYPSARIVKPSEMKNASFKAGGLVFVDNTDPKDLTFTSTPKPMPIEKDMIIIGRIKSEALAEIVVNGSFYCKANTAFKNLRLRTVGDKKLFTTAGSAMNPKLIVQDTDIIGSSGIIWDSNVKQCFSSVYVDNSTIKLVTGKHLMTFSKNKEASVMQALTSVVFTNNVIYADGSSQNHIINLGARDSKSPSPNVNIVFKNNTIYDIFNPSILIRASVAKGMEVIDNVGYYNAAVNKKNSLTAIYDKTITTATVTGNYLFTESTTETNTWAVKHTGGYTIKGNTLKEKAENPFSPDLDVKNAYFPINPKVVTNGAGANYTDKYWITK